MTVAAFAVDVGAVRAPRTLLSRRPGFWVRGVSADELAARNRRDRDELNARELRRSLLDERLAVEHEGLLTRPGVRSRSGGVL